MTVLGNLSIDDPSEPFRRRSAAYSTRRVLRRIREAIGDDPVFLPIVLRATPTGTVRQITDRTELVIEGYPRSGNTFSFFAIKHAERAAGREIQISSHVHVPAQVKLAVSLRLPTILVIRRPIDAITSLLIGAPHVRFGAAIDEWIHHHEEVLPYRQGYVLAPFERATRALGEVTDEVNDRFGTSIARFDATPESEAAVFAAIDEHHGRVHGGTENLVPRPSSLRRAEKEWLLEQLSHPPYREKLERAQALYETFLTTLDTVESPES